MKKLLSLLFLMLLVQGYTKAQNRGVPPSRMPQVTVKNLKETEKPVEITEIKTDVNVVGSLAVTTVEMIISNPNNRILEGELEFPLADGQSISRLALDINGKLREGVAVDKAKGQEAFESVVRRNVDPALLEKTVGNNFKLRVYPLPAQGTRRVVIAYEQELNKNDDSYRFVLPVEYGNVLKKFDLHLSVLGSQTTPKIDETPWGTFSFDREGTAYVANYSKENFDAKGQLVFSIPDKQENNTYIEKGKISASSLQKLVTNPLSDEYVFFSKIYPDVVQKSTKLPKTIDIYWDASSSMSKRNIASELDLLGKYLSGIKNVTINLYTFNVVLNKSEKFQIKNGDWSKLKAKLETQKYDGATQFGIINLKKSNADQILIFSDGITNLGKSDITIGNQPIMIINSSMVNDDSNLKYIALSSGGKYISLLNQTPNEALDMLKSENYRLISIDYNHGQIKDLTTSGSQISPQTGFFIAGKLLSNKATIKLSFGIGNKVLDTQKIELNVGDAGNYNNIVERVWAAKRIEELDLRYERNKDEITALGKKYNIVTRNTSLIVLENVSDYLEYDITPPEELRAEYDRLKKEQWARKEDQKLNKIARILSLLNTRKDWWNTVFEYKPVESKRPNQRLVNSPGNTRGVVTEESGETLIGVTVTVKNTNKSVITNVDGEFAIDASVGDILVFSYIGFNTKEVSVSSTSIGRVILEDSNHMLEETVVVAMGSARLASPVIAESIVVEEDREMRTESVREMRIAEVDESIDIVPNDYDLINSMNSEISERRERRVVDAKAAENSNSKDNINPLGIRREPKNTVTLKNWTPDAPYIDVLKNSSDKDLYTTYLGLKEEYATTPSFYLDVASIMEDRGLKAEAFLVLSNVAELDLQNYKLIRVLAHRLLQLGYTDYAIDLFEKVLVLRPEEPQSYRDLALANEQAKNYQKAIDLYNEALFKNWDSRFRDIEIILLEEMNHVIAVAQQNKVNIDLSNIDNRLIFNMPIDVRIVLNWDTDNSDMDLWVTDPTGERCFYSHPKTKIGGMISADFTGGYGPEEFLIKNAIAGKYLIQSNYYSSREQTLTGPTTIYLDIFTNYGKPNESKRTIMLRLTKNKETIDIGEVEW